MSSEKGIPGDAAFCFNNVSKGYVSREGVGISALDDISFKTAEKGITCIVGPTGSGKSTILRIAAGIEAPVTGVALIARQNPSEMAGRIGYLTQRHTLFPWMRVRDNIGLPFEIRGINSVKRKEKVGIISETLGLQKAVDLYPNELSGGMQQRAALGRLMATESLYWLMDEPFSALDDRTSHQLQRLLLKLVRENGISVLFVTHSIDEAVFLADKVIVLSAGPGSIVDQRDIPMSHPRDRLSGEYGQSIEMIRCRIESVLADDDGTPVP